MRCIGKMSCKCTVYPNHFSAFRPRHSEFDPCKKSSIKKKLILVDHEKTENKLEFKYTCSVCHRRFSGLSNYKEHMASHDSIPKQACNVCGEEYEFRQCLVDHMATLHGYTEIKCPTCEQRFTSHDALREHTAAIHEGRVFSCKFCGKQFKWRSSFNYHNKKCGEQFLLGLYPKGAQ